MDEVAQADFRTDAEWGECGGVLPRAEVARVAFLLVEETLRENTTATPVAPDFEEGSGVPVVPAPATEPATL